MNRLTALFLGVFLASAAVLPAMAAETYTVDTKGRHYYAGFQISHLGFSIMHGRFDELSGSISYDAANPAASTVSIVIKAASINTNNPKRDGHLKSPDFFNAEEFPEITFTSTKIVPGADGSAKVTGDLTMVGVTKSITLDARLIKAGAHPFKKTPMAAWSARGTIKRSDFGIKYGLPLISDEITLLLDIEALKQ
jgi:polyisoprenoid-binding protein YceI